MEYVAAALLVAVAIRGSLFVGKRLRDYQLAKIAEAAKQNSRMLRWQQKMMRDPSYVFSFRIAAGIEAGFLVSLAVQVLIQADGGAAPIARRDFPEWKTLYYANPAADKGVGRRAAALGKEGSSIPPRGGWLRSIEG